MAKNGPNGGRRIGAIGNRSQFVNPKTGLARKRNTEARNRLEQSAQGESVKARPHKMKERCVRR